MPFGGSLVNKAMRVKAEFYRFIDAWWFWKPNPARNHAAKQRKRHSKLEFPLNISKLLMKCFFFFFQSVADCVEAIIGTYLQSGGILAAVKILEWFRIIPPEVSLSIVIDQCFIVSTLQKVIFPSLSLYYSHSILSYKDRKPIFICPGREFSTSDWEWPVPSCGMYPG